MDAAPAGPELNKRSSQRIRRATAVLVSAGFTHVKTLCEYASQFLIVDLLSVAWCAELYFDEYGGSLSVVDEEFQVHLKLYVPIA